MKKIVAYFSIVFVFWVTLTGCAAKELTYYGNLGYSFDNINCTKLVFKVYHSNTENHMWEQIAELSCNPTEDHCADIRVDCSQNHIAVILEDNYSEKSKDTESFYTNDVAQYEFDIEDYNGSILTYKNFGIRDTTEEQFYRLYPIHNNSGTIFTDLDLNRPCDVEKKNIDNLLVTITIER